MADHSLLPVAPTAGGITQTGVAYAGGSLTSSVTEEIRAIASEMMAHESIHTPPSLIELFQTGSGTRLRR